MPPQEGQNKNFSAFGDYPFPKNLKLEKDGFETFGGSRDGGGGLEFEQSAPLAYGVYSTHLTIPNQVHHLCPSVKSKF